MTSSPLHCCARLCCKERELPLLGAEGSGREPFVLIFFFFVGGFLPLATCLAAEKLYLFSLIPPEQHFVTWGTAECLVTLITCCGVFCDTVSSTPKCLLSERERENLTCLLVNWELQEHLNPGQRSLPWCLETFSSEGRWLTVGLGCPLFLALPRVGWTIFCSGRCKRVLPPWSWVLRFALLGGLCGRSP